MFLLLSTTATKFYILPRNYNNKMERKIAIISLIVMIIVVVGLSYIAINSFAVSEDKTIKVGAILPLSGKNAEWGDKTQKGIEFALNELDKEENLMIFYEDSASDSSKAITEAHKLIEIDNVNVLMCQLSDICSTIAPIAQENKIPLLGFTNTPDFTKTGEYIFNMRGDSTDGGKELGVFASSRYNKVVVFYLNNPTQKGIYLGFKDIFENNGRNIVLAFAHQDSTKDFKTELMKAKEENPDALLFASRPTNVIDLVKQARELGINQPIISTLGIDSKSFITSLGNLSEGIVYPTTVTDYDIDNVFLRNELEKYKQIYGENMPIWAAEGYDAINLLVKFASKRITSSEDIRDNLALTKTFAGLSGNNGFDEKRVVHKKIYIFVVRGGKFVKY
jgi:branched-chain amino acid transport system substrate-binding protein